MLHRPNKTRAAKEGVIEPSAADIIRPFVADLNEPPRYALHFGTVDKVGVNPTSKYNTPLAVCAYPLTQVIFHQFVRLSLPFAQRDAKYVYLLEIEPDARVFYSTKSLFDLGVGPEYLDADLSNIEISKDDEITITAVRNAPFSTQFFYSTRPSGYYKNKQYFVKGGTAARAAQWGHKLWKMGIDVWVDADDEGILHPNEPSQVMFFNPSSYRVVLALDNPKNALEARFGRDWRRRKDIDPRDFGGVSNSVLEAMQGEKYLSGANLFFADLSGADLRDVRLNEADLTKANLSEANLTGAQLKSARLEGANLQYAKLYKADLTNARLSGAKLKGVKYDASTIWPGSVRDVLRVWRGDEDLSGAVLYSADLEGLRLTHANLEKANLAYANLKSATLMFVDLTGAKLNSANLKGADLMLSDLTGANINFAQFDETTKWPDEFLDFVRAYKGAKDLFRANLKGANLSGMGLSDCFLAGANLVGANLRDANLLESNLTGADLTGADLTGAELEGVIYDNSTIWPEGFTPPPSANYVE